MEGVSVRKVAVRDGDVVTVAGIHVQYLWSPELIREVNGVVMLVVVAVADVAVMSVVAKQSYKVDDDSGNGVEKEARKVGDHERDRLRVVGEPLGDLARRWESLNRDMDMEGWISADSSMYMKLKGQITAPEGVSYSTSDTDYNDRMVIMMIDDKRNNND